MSWTRLASAYTLGAAIGAARCARRQEIVLAATHRSRDAAENVDSKRARLAAIALACAWLGRAEQVAGAEECLKDAECPGEQICEGHRCLISHGPDDPGVAPPKEVAKPDEAPKRYAKPDEPPPKGAVMVTFDPAAKGQHWALETAADDPICELPCKRRVAPDSGLKLRLRAKTAEEQQLLAVPDAFGFAAGEKLRAVATPARDLSWPWVGTGIGIAAVGVVVLGVGLSLALVDCKTATPASGAVSGGMVSGATGGAATSVPAGCDPHNLDPQYVTNPGNHTATGLVLSSAGAASIVLGACAALIAGVTWSPVLRVRSESAKAGAPPALAISPDGVAGAF